MNRPASQQSDQLLSSSGSSSNYNTMERGAEVPLKETNKVKKCLKIILITLLVIIFMLLLFVYLVIPLTIRFSSTIRRHVLFLGFATSDKGLSDPESFGIECSRNFFVSSDPHVRIGTWYVQSKAMECVADQTWYPGNLTTVLYLHGITKTRRGKNRIELMKKLSQEVKVHVVAIDYRGFGDSTNEIPSLEGVVADSLATYKRLRTIMPAQKIVIWGHSLGSSVAMYLAAKLHEQGDDPAAVILEAALDSVGNVVGHNRLAKPYRWLPWFDTLITKPFENDPATGFNSTAMAEKINPRVPILMLHAKDDRTIPFDHGFDLYQSITKARENVADAAVVTFVPFAAAHGFGHSLIVFYDSLPNIVVRFLNADPVGPPVVEPVL